MHFLLSAWAATIAVAGLSGQTLLGPKASAIQHVTVETGAMPETAAAGKKIALHVDVTPKPNIHVYAPGAKEFSAVSLVLTPQVGVTAGKPVYPAAHPALVGEDDVPAYRKPFRITQPITVQAAKEDVVIAGVLHYQACDDRLCYPVASLPVSWTIHAR
jgi:DsbC/DsbD-like thiol-disulfide interchange protein